MFPALKNNAAAGYQGPVKIQLLEGAGLLLFFSVTQVKHASEREIVPARRVSAREAIFASVFRLLEAYSLYSYWFS